MVHGIGNLMDAFEQHPKTMNIITTLFTVAVICFVGFGFVKELL